MKKYDVLNIGAILADFSVPVGIHSLDFQTDMICVPDLALHPGGDAVNSSLALVRLGKQVMLCGVVGQDPFGAAVVDTVRELGVDVSQVRAKSDVATLVSIALINDAAERTFVSNYSGKTGLLATDIDSSVLPLVKHLNISSLCAFPELEAQGGPELLEKAHSFGISTSADTISDLSGRGFDGICRMVEHLDLFMPSSIEAKAMSGESDPARMVRFFLSKAGERVIIIKLGAQGCFVHEPEGEYYVPAFRTHAVDTTGAGDCFVGGVISAYLDGLCIRDCVRYGAAAAAINIQYTGANTPFLTTDSVHEILNCKDY